MELAIGDLTAEGAGQRAVDVLLTRWGGIDVLVNNAGWSVPGFIAADTDRANVICPGLVLPDGPEAVGEASLWAAGEDAVFNADQIEYLRKDIPLRRLTDAADIARAVTWISSGRAARQVTGQVISVSGGYTMP